VSLPAPAADRRSWLAVIDMQWVFADAGSPWAAPRFADIVEPVSKLVAAFGDRTVFTRFLAPDEPVGAWRAYYADWPFALVAADDPRYRLVPAFAAAADAAVTATTFGKWGVLAQNIADRTIADRVGAADRPSAVDRPGAVNRSSAVDQLVVCGVSTDCCVLSTVLAAADAGVEVLVVADACAGATDESHQRAVDAMSLYAPLVRIVTTAEVLAELSPVDQARPSGR
jgi:nicotinamidase-related amidase